MFDIAAPKLEHITDLRVDLAPIREMGPGRAGARRIIQITGGTMQGPHLNGRILNLGADWQTIWADGTAELDTRYGLETDDGAVIEIINYGYRHGPKDVVARIAAGDEVDPAEYYMRTHARLETGDARYDWVNRMLFVGTGGRFAGQVHMRLFALR